MVDPRPLFPRRRREDLPLGPRLLGLLQAESRPRREDGVGDALAEALVEDQRLCGTPGDEVSHRVLSRVEDYVRVY